MNDHMEILGPSSSPTTGKLTEALAKAQSEYQAVKLDSSNPHFKSRFASYQQCCESLRVRSRRTVCACLTFGLGLSVVSGFLSARCGIPRVNTSKGPHRC